MSSLDVEKRQMDDANRLKREFLARMSHDLRTPLHAIIGFADLMVKGKLGLVTDDHKEYLGDILSSSHHLLHLLDGMIDFAKIESAKTVVCVGPLRLDAIVAEVRDLLHRFAASKGIHVAVEMDAALAEVVLDASKLEHVLYAYLSNALKCTPEGGAVTVRVLAEGVDRFRLEVEDSGEGSATTSGDTGTAGLTLAHGIVEAEGGRAGVRHQAGLGSAFWAVLPRSGATRHAG